MARHDSGGDTPPRRRTPARTPEDRESMLISMAMDRAQKQMEEGTASSQLITHFAKLGSSRERLEQERLRNENDLLRKKVESLEAAVDIKHLMEDALYAFKNYSGDPDDTYDPDDEDDFY